MLWHSHMMAKWAGPKFGLGPEMGFVQHGREIFIGVGVGSGDCQHKLSYNAAFSHSIGLQSMLTVRVVR